VRSLALKRPRRSTCSTLIPASSLRSLSVSVRGGRPARARPAASRLSMVSANSRSRRDSSVSISPASSSSLRIRLVIVFISSPYLRASAILSRSAGRLGSSKSVHVLVPSGPSTSKLLTVPSASINLIMCVTVGVVGRKRISSRSNRRVSVPIIFRAHRSTATVVAGLWAWASAAR